MAGEENSKMEIDSTTPVSKGKKPKLETGANPSASAEAASKYPDMKLAQNIHQLIMINDGKLDESMMKATGISTDLRDEILKQIIEDMENPSLYRFLTSQLTKLSNSQKITETKLTELDTKNKERLAELEKKVVDAKENAGDMEVLEGRFEVARFAAKSLSKDEALAEYQKIVELPKLSSGKTIDAFMEAARVASFYNDTKQSSKFIESASKKVGDWDRRNRLKVYSALEKLNKRDVKEAAALLIDCIATFSCTELCSYKDFIFYTIISNVLHLPRIQLKEKIIDGPEILTVVNELPLVTKLVNTLYDCDYKGYLNAMVEVEAILISDRFFQPHSGYIMRELHVLGYKQFLDSYKSVTLESMSTSFGVSSTFLDLQLSRFIAAGRLTAKIDKVGGVVETNRPDLKNAQYRDMIVKGDLLLNRIQKLARVSIV